MKNFSVPSIFFNDGILFQTYPDNRWCEYRIIDYIQRLIIHPYFFFCLWDRLFFSVDSGSEIRGKIHNAVEFISSTSKFSFGMPLLLSPSKRDCMLELGYTEYSRELAVFGDYFSLIRSDKIEELTQFPYLHLHNLLFQSRVAETLEWFFKLPFGILEQLKNRIAAIDPKNTFGLRLYVDIDYPPYGVDLDNEQLYLLILIPMFVMTLIKNKRWPINDFPGQFLEWINLPDEFILEEVL